MPLHQRRRTASLVDNHSVIHKSSGSTHVRRRSWHAVTVHTESAQRATAEALARFDGVATRRQLRQIGIDSNAIATQLNAQRWRKVGRAIVLHYGPPTRRQHLSIALAGHGPRAVLTSFTALSGYGLRGWERPEIHLAVPIGTRAYQDRQLPRIVLYRSDQITAHPRYLAETCAAATVRAASSFASARHACGLLTAVVQQSAATVDDLGAAIENARRARHRRNLKLALADIEQGAQALSEIDFLRLCRKNGLPAPRLQQVRKDSSGLRRYLDAVWDLPDGRTLVVEVDGALHLAQPRWWADQLRQNDIALSGALILRFPSAIVRHEPHLVLSQLRRALASPTR
jgi:hypothetical protein